MLQSVKMEWNGKLFLPKPVAMGAAAPVSVWTSEVSSSLQSMLVSLLRELEREDLTPETRRAIMTRVTLTRALLDRVRGAVATTLDDL